MRRFTQALAIFVLVGCGGSDPQPQVAEGEPQPAATETQPAASLPATSAPTTAAPKRPIAELQKESVTTSEAAWAAKDIEKLLTLYTPDAKIVSFGQTGTKEVGTAEMEKELGGLFKGMSEVKLKTARAIQNGNVLVAEWVVVGTTMDKKQVGFPGVSVMWFADDGKIQREHLYMDDQTIGMQMGMKGLKGRNPVQAPASTEWVTVAGNDEEKKNLEAVKALYTVLDKKDAKGFEAAITDDVTFADLARPEDIKGKAKVKADFQTFTKAFPDLKFEPKQMFAAGKYVVVEGQWTGTMKAALGPLKATNKTGSVHYVDVMEVNGGKVSKMTTYANGAEFAASFLPPPPAAKDAGAKDAKGGAAKDAGAQPATPAAEPPKKK